MSRILAFAVLSITALSLLAAPPAAQKAAPPTPVQWIDSPEAYFVTAAERSEWDLTVRGEAAAAQKFIDEYWRKHGPAFEQEVKARVAFADQHFGFGGTPGSRTAQGRVWIILGSPSTQREIRGAVDPSQSLQNNTVEQRGRTTLVWTYRGDKLPKELNLPSLTVNIINDMSRGFQNIENLGVVEPQLARAVELFVKQHPYAAPQAPQGAPQVPTGPQAEDPLWKAPENLAGTFISGEPFISAREKSFYAVSFYVPKSVFPDAKSVTFVGLVRNGSTLAANVREKTELRPYGDGGDRYVDQSLQLAPGNYSGTFALLSDDGATTLATHHADFEVVAPSSTRVSSLFLTSQIDVLDKQLEFDPFTFVATKYAVKGNRRFRATDKIGFFTVVDNPAGEPSPSMTMRMIVSKNGAPLDKTPPDPAPLVQAGPHSWIIGTQFEGGTFKPGHYSIELQLRDIKADKESEAFKKGYVKTVEFDVE